MICIYLEISVAPEMREETLDILYSLQEPTRAKFGCIRCQVFQGVKDRNRFTLIEEWENEENLSVYIRSRNYQMILTLMDMSISSPIIEFKSVSQIKRMEYISEIRS
jgi:quinol monooxygenase YgiN